MGYSCSARALDTLRTIDDTCHQTTGMQNCWKLNGREYMYEISHREHDDGSITGTVNELLEPIPGDKYNARNGRKIGYFKINGDGNIVRMPQVMKLAMKASHR